MSLKQTFLIGLSQCLAFIPGVSRSGVTMTAGRIMGVTRESAAKYSFMLSAPIVFAATVYKLKDFVFSIPFLIGVITSFIVGIFVIKYFLFVKEFFIFFVSFSSFILLEYLICPDKDKVNRLGLVGFI